MIMNNNDDKIKPNGFFGHYAKHLSDMGVPTQDDIDEPLTEEEEKEFQEEYGWILEDEQEETE